MNGSSLSNRADSLLAVSEQKPLAHVGHDVGGFLIKSSWDAQKNGILYEMSYRILGNTF